METILSVEPEAQPGIQEQEPQVGQKLNPAPAPEPTAFDFKSMLGDAGEFSENWRDGLPEGIRGERCLENIKNIGTLAQSYVHAQHAIGANKVAVPNENSTPEEWSAFYKAGGRPDSAEAYSTEKVKLPEGVSLDDARVDEFRKFAFENGMNQKMFEAALAYDIQRVQNQVKESEAAAAAEYTQTLARLKSDEASGALREKFGPETATVNALIQQCNKAMQTFGLTKTMQEKGLLNNYDMITALAQIGARISESKLKGGSIPASVNNPRMRLEEIQMNPDDPYYNREHPAHSARVAEVNQLLADIARQERSNG